MKRTSLRHNFWLLSVSVLFAGQWLLTPAVLQASEDFTATDKGFAFARVISPPTLINLPDWPIVEIDTSNTDGSTTQSQQIPLLFSFSGSPYSLYTLSIPEQDADSTGSIELNSTSSSVGFFDDSGLQSFQLQLLLDSGAATEESANEEPLSITVEHN